MKRLHNPNLVNNARKLRKTMTKEERKLWYDFLATLPIKFQRQKVIGCYVVDFYCAGKKLIIELDGSQHYEDKGVVTDKERDSYFKAMGYSVLRYSNRDINLNFKNVCEDLYHHLLTD